MEWIDTHCHLDEESFTQDCHETIQRAVDAGVTRMLTIGTTLDSCRRALELAQKYDSVFAVVGLHPNYIQAAQPGDWERIVELSTAPKVVGLGETGLDKYWDHSPIELQMEYFDRHIELSRKLDLPFVVHCREAEVETVALLRRHFVQGPLRGVMHAFCGSADTAAACLEMGMYLSFGGMVTFKRNEELRQVSLAVPLDRLLVETDAPYLSPTPFRGKRNEPAHVRLTAAYLAETRGVSKEVIAAATTENAQRLFRLA